MERRKRWLRLAVGLVPDLLCLAGAACLAAGAGLIYPPAGLLAAGALLLLGAARWRPPWGGGGA